MSNTLPIVLDFAAKMEEKLDANRHKGDQYGWRKKPTDALIDRLLDEVEELRRAADQHHHSGMSYRNVDREAADVANFAMMVADRYRNGTPAGRFASVRPSPPPTDTPAGQKG